MTRMLALSGQLYAHRVTEQVRVYGLPVKARRTRRIARARERAALLREWR